ncbi:MAG: GNAT family N-acetyltransferase [Synergistaceae bacterium]|nr:GNAT family N-acetyltransferase [Synergistaceae bacterium]
MFRLRELERRDIPSINSWRNDPELIANLGAPFRYINPDVDSAWYDGYMKSRSNSVRCAIVAENSDEIIGLVSLMNIDYMNQCAEFHIMIGSPQNQNRGAGTFAVNAMLEHAFMNLNLQRVELCCNLSNARAQHVYEKAGFIREGLKRKARFKHGEFIDVIQYAVLREDYLSLRRNNRGGGGQRFRVVLAVSGSRPLRDKLYCRSLR